MGRGPKATISFIYCMARAESNAGGGTRHRYRPIFRLKSHERRGPKATISFTYCMARAESNAGGGPLSGEIENLGGARSAEVVEAGIVAAAGRALLSWSHVTRVTANESNKIGREARSEEHRVGEECRSRW